MVFRNIEFNEPEPGVGCLMLNRPDCLNALSIEMVEEVHALFRELRRNERVRVLLITGQGRGFCAGADLRDESILGPAMAHDASSHLDRVQKRFSSLIVEMRQLPQPIISIVNGPAAGGGMCIALASDIIIAGPCAAFTASFINIGLSGCELGSSFILPRLVGVARASDILLTGRTVHAHEAAQIGLVSLLVEEEERLMDAAMKKAQTMLGKSSLGLRLTKEALNRNQTVTSLEAAINLEDLNQSICVTAPDFLKNVEGFVKKRTL